MIHKNGMITVLNNKTGGQYGGFNTGMESAAAVIILPTISWKDKKCLYKQ